MSVLPFLNCPCFGLLEMAFPGKKALTRRTRILLSSTKTPCTDVCSHFHEPHKSSFEQSLLKFPRLTFFVCWYPSSCLNGVLQNGFLIYSSKNLLEMFCNCRIFIVLVGAGASLSLIDWPVCWCTPSAALCTYLCGSAGCCQHEVPPVHHTSKTQGMPFQTL